MSYAIVEAPSILGLMPSGVERLPEVLLRVGLGDRLGARRFGRVEAPQYNSNLDAATNMLNPRGIAQYSIIAYDGSEYPPYTMADYMPSTVPGCRTPHFWLADDKSLYDALGREFTLLKLDAAIDIAPLVAAAERRTVPLTVLDIASSKAADLYSQQLVLSRPDQHVAWRGHALPADPLALIDRVRGAAN